jgi:hypothetical protein
MKAQYKRNKEANIGSECTCPSCGTVFAKTHYAQAFCKSKGGTICKDKYWNTVDPKKRNNTTRISPASARWMERQEELREDRMDRGNDYDPGDSEYWDSKDYSL